MSQALDLPKIIGHRGAAALAPENTLVGIRRAWEEGASWVEFDVKLTADDVPILLHDERLSRTTDGKGKVAAKTLAEIQPLDAGGWFGPEFAGERVPTLEAALALCIELGLGINLELKPCKGREIETARLALNVLLDLWPDRLPGPLISSFDQVALGAAKSLVPSLARGCLVTRVPVKWRERLEKFGCRTLNVSNRWIRKRHIEAAKRAGVPVLVYTVNDPARAIFLFEQGVRSIFSDRVDVMAKALTAYCQPSPGRTLTAAAGSITSV
ncbi:MAG: glycerophosphodiester phosphodiesterase [Alphaproteobacteria bacterium]